MAGIKRREFMAGSAALACTCACGASGCKMITGKGDTPEIPAGAYIIGDGKVEVQVDQVPALSKIGGSVKITDPKLKEPLIIVHTGEREYAALSLLCTHGQRELEYAPAEKKLRCVSFGHSEFGLDGSLIKGPAKKALNVYPAAMGLILNRDKLTIRMD